MERTKANVFSKNSGVLNRQLQDYTSPLLEISLQKRESKDLLELVAALSQAHSEGNRAGRVLHDRVGPLLTGAGLRLQLLRLDQPKTSPAVTEVLDALDQAMEQIREMSQSLAPSVVYRLGLPNALEQLIRERQAEFNGTIRFKFSAAVTLELELGALLFDAIQGALDDALARPGSSKVTVSVAENTRFVTARIQDNGKNTNPGKGGVSRLLAEEAGFVFSQTTRKGTIVLIRHGISRSSRG